MEIKRVAPKEYDAVKALILDVFMEFEAPDYGSQGIETFQRESIKNAAYMESLDIFGAYTDGQLVGVIATRGGGNHIALLFVKGAYHRQGIGRALFEAVKRDNMTVYSSPYAEKVYEHFGFIRTGSEQSFEGMRFIPMKYAPTVRALFERLTSKDKKDGYQALPELETLSDETGALYPYTQRFADMVASERYVERVRGFRLFCKQAKWDVDCKLDENIDHALAILHDPKPTAVRMALAALLDVLSYKPELRQTILTAVQSINYKQYKDSMQGLIFKDVQRLMQTPVVALRPMALDNLPLFKKWLAAPHVAMWYHHPLNWIKEIENQDGKYNWIHHYITEADGQPIGFCQYYSCCDSDEDWFCRRDLDSVYSIDYMIGEHEYVGRGFGKALVFALLREIKKNCGAREILVQPEQENAASRKLLLSCGFTYDAGKDIFSLAL